MIDEVDLVLLVAKCPADFLTDKSLDSLSSFLIGVDAGLATHGKGPIEKRVDPQFLKEWFFKDFLVTEEHASRLNAFNCMCPQSYCELMTNGEQDAFDLYIKIRREASLVSSKAEEQSDKLKLPESGFFEFIEFVKKRPGMYVSSWDISAYENIARGFIYAEEKILSLSSDLNNELKAFKRWLDQRYPYGVNRPFSKVIKFTSLGQRHTDVEYFEEHLDMFRTKDPPDEIDRTQKIMVESILNHAKNLEE